jgi:hypothetical protein
MERRPRGCRRRCRQENAIAIVDHDGAGQLTGLYPIPWWACQPILVAALVSRPSRHLCS